MSSISSEINRYSLGPSSITANALSARIWWYKHTSNHRTDTNTAGRVLSNSVCKLKNGFSLANRGWRSSTLPMQKIPNYMHIYICWLRIQFCEILLFKMRFNVIMLSVWLQSSFIIIIIIIVVWLLLLLILPSYRINEDSYNFLFDGMHSFVFISNCNFITNS